MSNGQTSGGGGYWGTFVWALLLGMGFHVGWGLIALIIWAAAKAVGQADVPMIR